MVEVGISKSSLRELTAEELKVVAGGWRGGIVINNNGTTGVGVTGVGINGSGGTGTGGNGYGGPGMVIFGI